jgi:flagellar P-ring protein precursor FlgI
MNRCVCLALIICLAGIPVRASQKVRLKDLVSLEGIRDNDLIGYGLVVGLRGTGDRQQTIFSVQSLTNLLQQMGVSAPASAIRVMNTAAVMVTATLPAFAQPGTKIDATVAAMGDASNLQGGILIMTSLRGVDGQIYSIAQGPVVTGGFVAGRGGNSQSVNHPTVGRVPGGAIVERPAPSVTPSGGVRLQLKNADFTTAARISEAVNQEFSRQGSAIAHADNSGVVSVVIPARFASQTTEFIAELEKIQVEADTRARVVVNERTGTVIMGKDVKVAPVAIMHGNLVVEIETSYAVSQPESFSSGKTEVVPQVGVTAKEEKARNLVLKEGATVEELVRALGSIGSTPRDIIAILQSLRTAGALEADLDVM